VGIWEKTIDPDGDPKDWLRFEPDGRVASLTALDAHPSFAGIYRIEGDKIHLDFVIHDRHHPIEMRRTADPSKLLFMSKETGSAATYERREAPWVATVNAQPPRANGCRMRA
jgi:hypothetical protein